MVSRADLFNIFNFRVEFFQDANAKTPLYEAAFSELDGLEVTMEAKTLQEGGNNTSQIHLAGAFSYAQLNLKRGMTRDVSLWRWFQDIMTVKGRGTRYVAHVTMLSNAAPENENGERSPHLIFKIYDCLPIKVRAPAFNAGEGGIAIEEMTLVYSRFDVELPDKKKKGST